MKVEVYVTNINQDGKQYVGVVDGNIRRLHFSSSDGFALREDIVPTMKADFGVEPTLRIDDIDLEIAQQLENLNAEYKNYIEHNPHMPMDDWLDMVAKSKSGDNDE